MDINHYDKYKKDFWTRLLTAVQFVNNGLYGLMDTNGDVALDAKYDHIEICFDFVYAHYGTRHKFFIGTVVNPMPIEKMNAYFMSRMNKKESRQVPVCQVLAS